jgi:hypothetical protein
LAISPELSGRNSFQPELPGFEAPLTVSLETLSRLTDYQI